MVLAPPCDCDPPSAALEAPPCPWSLLSRPSIWKFPVPLRAPFTAAPRSVPLFADPTAQWRESALFEYYLEPMYPNVPTWHGVRNQQWKYIHYDDFPTMDELYDLKSDPYEMKNLIKETSSADTLRKMKAQLAKLVEENK